MQDEKIIFRSSNDDDNDAAMALDDGGTKQPSRTNHQRTGLRRGFWRTYRRRNNYCREWHDDEYRVGRRRKLYY